jgi:hypothetical protein
MKHPDLGGILKRGISCGSKDLLLTIEVQIPAPVFRLLKRAPFGSINGAHAEFN